MADRWRVLWLLSFARIAMGFQFQSVGSVAPALSRELDLGLAELGGIIGAYLLPGAVLALPGAMLGARFGERRAVALGLLLMIAGGAGCALARDADELLRARVLAGAGGVLFNVVSTKLIADWFAGREIAQAMAIFISTWPIGMAIALPLLGALSEGGATGLAFLTTSLMAAAGLAAVLVRPISVAASAATQTFAGLGLGRLTAREWMLAVVLAGIAWGLYNVAFAGLASFLPTVLTARGATAGEAATVAMSLVLGIIVSIQLGGWLSSRVGRPDLLAYAGLLGWAAATAALLIGGAEALWLVAGGIVSGLATGALVSLPAQILRPAVRAAGTGAFYTVYYLMMALMPRELGRFAQHYGSADGVVVGAVVLILLTAVLLAAVRLAQRRGRDG